MSNTNRTAGAVIRAERERKQMTQEEVAAAAGLSQGAVSHIELDDHLAGPRGRYRAARALGLTLTAEQVIGEVSDGE